MIWIYALRKAFPQLRVFIALLGMQGYKPGPSGRCACDPALSPNCLACVVPGTCGPTPGQLIAGEPLHAVCCKG